MFSPSRIVFWLTVALQGVSALNAAAPFEMVYLYYAYKMEYLTVAAGSRKIAPACPKLPFHGNPMSPLGQINANTAAAAIEEGVDGICTFYEFWQYVGTNAWRNAMQSKEVPRGGPNNIASINDPLTRTLNPDADRLAVAVNDPATIGDNSLLTRPNHLYSTADLAAMGGVAPEWYVAWSDQLKKASRIVEASRKEMANRLRLNPDDAGVQALVDRFQTWVNTAIDNLSTVHQFRVGDSSRFLVPAQQAHVSWTSSPMNTHAIIDTPQYLNKAGNPSQLIRWVPAVEVEGVITPAHQAIDATYQVVNFEASWVAASATGNALTSAQKKALKAFVATYGTVAGTIEKIHRDVIDTVKFARDLHRKPIPTSFLDSLGDCISCCVIS